VTELELEAVGGVVTTVYPKTALAEYKHVAKGSCFVMMPFDPSFDHIYRRILETLQAPGLDIAVARADDFREANILGSILRSIAKSEYIVADLSGLNANVCYETGIAHCVKDADHVILLTQSISDVPFDLRHLRCIVYQNSPAGMKQLKAELTATFESLFKDRYRFRIRQGSHFTFDKRLIGRDRNFFELEFSCPYLACNAAKISVSFREISVTPIDEPAEDQFIVISEDQRAAPLKYLPWNLHLVRFEDDEASLVLEKRT
jgi:hypothetical protein